MNKKINNEVKKHIPAYGMDNENSVLSGTNPIVADIKIMDIDDLIFAGEPVKLHSEK